MNTLHKPTTRRRGANRFVRTCASAAALALALGGCGITEQPVPAKPSVGGAINAPTVHLDPTRDRLAAGLDAKVVIDIARASASDVDALVERFGASRTRVLSSVGFATVELATDDELGELLAVWPEASELEPDLALRPSLAQTLAFTGQPAAVATGQQGQGWSAVVMDTGTDYRHAEFGSCTSAGEPAGCRVIVHRDIAPEDDQLDASNHHGTNVAGIVAGTAPGASIISLDVFDGGIAWSSDIVAAANWVIEHKDVYNIAVVNLSVGGGKYADTCGSTSLGKAMTALTNAGVIAVAATGNDGYVGATGAPACAPDAIAVGAQYVQGWKSASWSACDETDISAGQPTCFSNVADFVDVYAPGVSVTAGGYTMSGTSMASPHVAGAMVVARAADPNASIATLRGRLVAGDTTFDPRVGHEVPQLDFASLVDSEPEPEPEPEPAPTGTVTIANGHSVINRTQVKVQLASTGVNPATEYCVSNLPHCDSGFVPMADEVDWNLVNTSGNKTVYAWFRSADGQTSETATATILVDVSPPIAGTVWVTPNKATADEEEAWTIAWEGFQDPHSGLRQYLVYVGPSGDAQACPSVGGFWAPPATSGAITVPASAISDDVAIKVCAFDLAGHAVASLADPPQ